VTDVVWVAGAGGGIGAACVRRLEAAGRGVVGTDRPEVDIAVPGGCETAVALAVAGGRRLVGAVHAVGMSGRRFGDGPVSQCSDEGWDEVLRVNLTSVFRFLRTTLRTTEDGGSVVVIGSALATTLDQDFLTAAYRAAKAALVPLVEAAAYEAAPRGVRVNVVAAGLVETPMAARALADERIAARLPQLMPLGGKAVTADEVAAAVEWLLSPASGRTTGAVVPVDGGWTLR
jgi:NAD(P)-dependent dehydrogenase (short-subunit alcohol dehydrogenase family)